MSPFLQKLQAAVRRNRSLVCVGLDPDPDRFPPAVRDAADPIFAFNRAIIEQTADAVCAYKLNLAFYEVAGPAGLEALERTVKAIPDDVPVIADAKRGDIDNTARMYARALFEYYRFDAATVNPYMGRDAVQPFLDYRDRGVFVLCLNSNPTAHDIQHLTVDGRPLYLRIAEMVNEWNAHGNCGLVVGATNAESLGGIRAIVPEMPLLIPGIGAQGGDLQTVVAHGTDRNGEGILVNASRSILYAAAADFATAARSAVITLRDEMNRLRSVR
ncbi:MAG: orotidine-5'-phosphate decarboxylase [Candidatus Latescibacteria bacterium]|nr:orotidine-5'-phosphate decarboxylase [Candidatus Latescibacterota bacterium]